MSRGLSKQQRSILEVLPEYAEDERRHSMTIFELAECLGRLDTVKPAENPEHRALQVAFQVPIGKPYLPGDTQFSLYRALRSLERRGLVDRLMRQDLYAARLGIEHYKLLRPSRWVKVGKEEAEP